MNYANPQVNELFLWMEDKMGKTVSVLKDDFLNIRAGRANPHILDRITIDYYGTQTPINQVGNIAVPEARMITISPWDTSTLKNIEKAILAANIGLTPSNDGKLIRLVFPELTEERRKDLVKTVKKTADESKVALRNIRRDMLDKCKKLKNEKAITEDDMSSIEKDVEKIINKFIEQVDAVQKDKEKEILSV